MNKIAVIVLVIFIAVVAAFFIMKDPSGLSNRGVKESNGTADKEGMLAGDTIRKAAKSDDYVNTREQGADIRLIKDSLISSATHGGYLLAKGTAIVDVYGVELLVSTPHGDVTASDAVYTVTINEDEGRTQLIVYGGAVLFTGKTYMEQTQAGWILICNSESVVLKKRISDLPEDNPGTRDIDGTGQRTDNETPGNAILNAAKILASFSGKDGAEAEAAALRLLNDVEWKQAASLIREMFAYKQEGATQEEIEEKFGDKMRSLTGGMINASLLMRELDLPFDALSIVGSIGNAIQSDAAGEPERKLISELSGRYIKELRRLADDDSIEFAIERSVRSADIYNRYEGEMNSYGHDDLLFTPNNPGNAGAAAQEDITGKISSALKESLNLSAEAQSKVDSIIKGYRQDLSYASSTLESYRVQLKLVRELDRSGYLDQEQKQKLRGMRSLYFGSGSGRVLDIRTEY